MSDQQPTIGQTLVRQVSQQDLAAIWSEAARYLEGLAERLSHAADQSSQ